MGKCVVFSRVSTVGQHLESQVDVVMNEAIRLGYAQQDIITIADKESTVKLSKEDRKGIKELLEVPDLECVVIYELSRLSRRPKELYELRDIFLERNIQLICMTPNFKLITDGHLDMMANIVFGLFTSMAENECYLRAERCKRGREKKRLDGGYIGGRVLFGYEVDRGEIVPSRPKIGLIKSILSSNDMNTNYLQIIPYLDDPNSRSVIRNAKCMVKRILSHREIYLNGDKTYPKLFV